MPCGSRGALTASSGAAAESRVVVLHVLAPAVFGGLERVVSALAAGHSAAGHDVHVAVVVDREVAWHPFVECLAGGPVAVHELRPPPRGYRPERRAIADLCRSLRPDVVHTHGYRADVVDAPAARGLGIATVTTVHGFTGGGWRNRLYEALQVRAFRRFDAVVAVSRPLATQLARQGVPAGRLHTLPNAWLPGPPPLSRDEARRALGVPMGGRRIGFVGRLSREKGPDVFLDGCALLNDPSVAFSVIGDGRERAALERLAVARGLADRLTWHGAVPDAARLLRAFDVLVISSRTEGTPILAFEAMAAGVPLVAAAVGGVPDVVTADEAILVPPEEPEQLASALQQALGDPDRARQRASAASRRLGARFAAGPWLAAYEAVYRLATGGRA
jgi:glycosyltransferase involved in cell wall biosynthesis